MQIITDIAELESLYGEVSPAAINKVMTKITPKYREWISASRFLILSTVGEQGTDASPRGDVEAVVKIGDEKTLLLPDWRGNNRMDSLRNIVADGRVSLMFLVPGSNNVVRVNGRGAVTIDESITSQFEQKGKHPRSVVVVTVEELYFQCAKALMRSRLWQADDESGRVPSTGQLFTEFEENFDADAYDQGYEAYAEEKMW